MWFKQLHKVYIFEFLYKIYCSVQNVFKIKNAIVSMYKILIIFFLILFQDNDVLTHILKYYETHFLRLTMKTCSLVLSKIIQLYIQTKCYQIF